MMQPPKNQISSDLCKKAIAKALQLQMLREAIAIACYDQFYNRKIGISVVDIADLFLECGYAAPFAQIKEILDQSVAAGMLQYKVVNRQ